MMPEPSPSMSVKTGGLKLFIFCAIVATVSGLTVTEIKRSALPHPFFAFDQQQRARELVTVAPAPSAGSDGLAPASNVSVHNSTNGTVPGPVKSYNSDALGCVLVFAATLCGIAGVNTQKKSINQDLKLPPDQRKDYMYRPLWWLGLAGVIGSSVLDFVALGVAQVSRVSALGGGAALVGNVLVAQVINGEPATRRDLVGVLCVTVGAITLAVNAPEGRSYTYAELVVYASSDQFVVYMIVLVVSILGTLLSVAGSEVNRAGVAIIGKMMEPLLHQREAADWVLLAHISRLTQRLDTLEAQLKRGGIELRGSGPSGAGGRAAQASGAANGAAAGSAAAGTEGDISRARVLSSDVEDGGDAALYSNSGQASGTEGQEPLLQGRGQRSAAGQNDSDGESDVASTAPSVNWDTVRSEASKQRRIMRVHSFNARAQRYSERMGLHQRQKQWDPYKYAMCSGVIGALSVLLGGVVSKLLLMAAAGAPGLFRRPSTWLAIVAMLTTVITQTHFLNRALQMGDAVAVYPTFQAFWVAFGTIGGTIFYNNAADFNTTRWIVYVVAFTIMLIGVRFLASHESKLGGTGANGARARASEGDSDAAAHGRGHSDSVATQQYLQQRDSLLSIMSDMNASIMGLRRGSLDISANGWQPGTLPMSASMPHLLTPNRPPHAPGLTAVMEDMPLENVVAHAEQTPSRQPGRGRGGSKGKVQFTPQRGEAGGGRGRQSRQTRYHSYDDNAGRRSPLAQAQNNVARVAV